ncbi:Laminin subunit beta-1, partial [Bulinus truncatus]
VYFEFTTPPVSSTSVNAIPSLVIQKMDSSNQGWTALQYFSPDCRGAFPSVPLMPKNPSNFSVAYCQNVTIDDENLVLYQPGFTFGRVLKTSMDAVARFSATSVRILLLRLLAQIPDVNGATCNCLNNTAGQQCSSCLPLYNNQPWQMGNKTCQECSCNGHASSCVYDLVKGRACNCNPAGTNPAASNTCDVLTGQCTCKPRVTQRDCSQCIDAFWGLGANLDLGCNACSCNTAGTVNNTNNCNKTTGQCLCKVNVEGANCSQCKNLTYGYSGANPLGCSPCDCDPGASTQLACATDTGQCTCLGNIGGRDCRSPSAGYFVPRLDVVVLEPETYTAENVILRSGHGTLTATVSGRGFVNMTSSTNINITFNSTYSGLVDVVIRYETTAVTMVTLNGSLTPLSSYSCQDSIIQSGQPWPLSYSGDRHSAKGELSYSGDRQSAKGGISLGKVCLNSGSNFVLALSNYGAPMLVDSLVIAIKMVQYQTFVTSMETVLVGLMFKGKNVILVFQNILDFILAMVAPSVIAQQVIRWITVVMIMATVTVSRESKDLRAIVVWMGSSQTFLIPLLK